MGKEEKQRYTKYKNSLTMNNKKPFGKNRGTISAQKSSDSNNQKVMGKEENQKYTKCQKKYKYK